MIHHFVVIYNAKTGDWAVDTEYPLNSVDSPIYDDDNGDWLEMSESIQAGRIGDIDRGAYRLLENATAALNHLPITPVPLADLYPPR
jgi:hypothetical protein